VLAGHTYKFRWPGSAHAIYVTINDIEIDGRRRPFEIFINTKNLEHQAWTVALTRMISAVFRRGGDVTFVVEELKAIYDPQGGRWLDGRYVPSLLAAIGDIIEQHMLRIGFLAPDEVVDVPSGGLMRFGAAGGDGLGDAAVTGRPCPVCGVAGLLRQEGCWVCPTCGYSHCG
jgi:ribonucleoside-diphosphate reductase alpha chain